MTRELRIAHRAAVKIQKIVRGIQGKKRWLAEFWRSEGVVKSDAALQVCAPTCSKCPFSTPASGHNKAEQNYKRAAEEAGLLERDV